MWQLEGAKINVVEGTVKVSYIRGRARLSARGAKELLRGPSGKAVLKATTVEKLMACQISPGLTKQKQDAIPDQIFQQQA